MDACVRACVTNEGEKGRKGKKNETHEHLRMNE